MYPTEEELNNLYSTAYQKYTEGDFFLAHEYWEDMWHYKQLSDRIFIQGLIQISASFYKIQVGNLRGARSLLEKSMNKFENYSGSHRKINVDKLKKDLLQIQKRYNEIESTSEFDLNQVPKLD